MIEDQNAPVGDEKSKKAVAVILGVGGLVSVCVVGCFVVWFGLALLGVAVDGFLTDASDSLSTPMFSQPVRPSPTPRTTFSTAIVNNSGLDICYVYMRRAGQTSWGSDLLGPSTTIPADGRETTVARNTPYGNYELKIEPCLDFFGLTTYYDSFSMSSPNSSYVLTLR
jgi:hypothetical protein